jgi:hypothetical protein
MPETMNNSSRVRQNTRREIVNSTRQMRTFIGAMVVAGASATAYVTLHGHLWHPYFSLTVLVLAAVTSRMKVKLPGIDSNMSVNLPFLLTAIVNLSAAEAIAIACVSTVVQCWPKKNVGFKPEQMIFNVSMMALATSTASLVFHAACSQGVPWSMPLALAFSTAALLLGQTVPVAAIVAISEHKSPALLWWNLFELSFPYYIVSTGITSMLQTVGTHMGWPLALMVFPVMYAVHRSYRLYFGKMIERNLADTARARVLVKAAASGA